MAASVFAEDTVTEYEYEYEYTVTVKYQPERSNPIDVTYTFYATSQMEAMDIAQRMCAWEHGPGTVLTCGIPQETGKKRAK